MGQPGVLDEDCVGGESSNIDISLADVRRHTCSNIIQFLQKRTMSRKKGDSGFIGRRRRGRVGLLSFYGSSGFCGVRIRLHAFARVGDSENIVQQ